MQAAVAGRRGCKFAPVAPLAAKARHALCYAGRQEKRRPNTEGRSATPPRPRGGRRRLRPLPDRAPRPSPRMFGRAAARCAVDQDARATGSEGYSAWAQAPRRDPMAHPKTAWRSAAEGRRPARAGRQGARAKNRASGGRTLRPDGRGGHPPRPMPLPQASSDGACMASACVAHCRERAANFGKATAEGHPGPRGSRAACGRNVARRGDPRAPGPARRPRAASAPCPSTAAARAARNASGGKRASWVTAASPARTRP